MPWKGGGMSEHRYDPAQGNAVPYDVAGVPTPPSAIPATNPPTGSSPPSVPDQYTVPVGFGGPAVPDSTFAPDPMVPALDHSTSSSTPPVKRHSRTGAAWVALVVAAVVMIFLLIFIMQNSDPVQVRYFGFEGTLSLGVAMGFAAIAGALTAGLLGTVRILQLRARARRATEPH